MPTSGSWCSYAASNERELKQHAANGSLESRHWLPATWYSVRRSRRRSNRPAPAPRAPSHAPRAAAATPVPVARSLLMLAQRVVDQTSAASLFAAHSWYMPPPPPPPPPPASRCRTTPAAPTAPPLPFQFIGSYKPDGRGAGVFPDARRSGATTCTSVTRWTIPTASTAFANGQLVLTYKPLNIQQQLIAGALPVTNLLAPRVWRCSS